MVINATATTLVEVTIPAIWTRMLELVTAPKQHPEMMWVVTPLVITLFLIQFYFVKYSKEELGWNTAVGNTLVLVFVSLDLFRFIYNSTVPSSFLNLLLFPTKTLVAFVVIMGGLFLFMADFLHFLPKKVAFFFSSNLPINLVSYLAIVLIYTDMEISKFTLLAALMLFVILYLFFTILRSLQGAVHTKK